ncbi:DUF7692 domain-containing protein [Halomicrobium katesii]|uniref:DUF7692 domain-containing protein n=1 Tax=Halomicrobium katesii TaxID=437163 RepID=UPI0003714CA8|nr:hypothetical protein [Halomicrobium katesii]
MFTSIASDPPGSIRIRTDEGNRYRFDAIKRACDFYDANWSGAVAYACDKLVRIAGAVKDILNLFDSIEKRREIDNRLDRAASFEVDLNHKNVVGVE